jgi:hypothetical protein
MVESGVTGKTTLRQNCHREQHSIEVLVLFKVLCMQKLQNLLSKSNDYLGGWELQILP